MLKKFIYVISLSFLLAGLSCVSFSEYYDSKMILNKSEDRIAVLGGKGISKDMVDIFKVTLMKDDINVAEIAPYEIDNFFKRYYNGLKKNKYDYNSLTLNKNEITSSYEDVQKKMNYSYYKDLTDNLADNYLFLEYLFSKGGFNKILCIYPADDKYGIHRFITNYLVKVFAFNAVTNNVEVELIYSVRCFLDADWKNNYPIVFDRDINYANVNENDLIIPFMISQKRYFEISRRVTDIIVGKYYRFDLMNFTNN